MKQGSRGRVVVIGGSLVGLITGNLFHRAGWDVKVFERVSGNVEGRGAGITILPGLAEGFRAAGADVTEESLGVHLPARIALDRAGRVVAERPFSQVMTSWKRLYDELRKVFPDQNYRAGMTLERIEQDASRVTACFTGGERVEADLLVAADGLRSTARAQLLPESKPNYAGYIAWRCLTDEGDLSPATHASIFNRYCVCVAPGQQGIGYAVPGPGHGVEPGRRQFNTVWYYPVAEEGLRRLLTDDTGHYHANGIPPALISAKVRGEMIERAAEVLAPQFAEAVRRARLHFFQPIVDLEMPRLVFGRAVVIGDAAFTARPHVAMGVPKGAGDAIGLVKVVQESGVEPAGLSRFEAERLRIDGAMVARGRYLGGYMEAQLKSAQERQQAEAARVPEQVMMETAAPMEFV
ncbi:MAG TPA: FAD-dependent monooxygenase [Burkholderiales bacterium]|nr:FAD-dependent monooxygenase [Burkholderiales bacterium]